MSTSGDYHHGDLPGATLAAARELLQTMPAERISVRELARAAGVSHAAPYRHFGDRDGFLTALAGACFEEFLAAQLAAYHAAPAGAKLLAVGGAYVDFGVSNPHAFALVYSATVTRPGDPSAAVAPLAERHAALLREAVSDALAAGLLPGPRDPDDVGAALWSLAHGLTHLVSNGYLPRARVTDVLAALLQPAAG